MRCCGNCGVPARPSFLAPPAESSPDLDGRPGEPARATLSRWIQVCPSCHAAAPDLSRLQPAPVPSEPDPFRRWALAAGPDAAEAWLWAAWSADDAGHAPAAQDARRRAAAAWGEPAGAADALRRVDVLRRAGEFAAANTALDRVEPQDEQAEAIRNFLRARIAVADAGRHMLSSALRPPSRRPHVSHVQPRRSAPAFTSLWARLTRRR